MNVIVIESQAFQKLERLLETACVMAGELAEENKSLKAKKLLSAREVAEMTGYNEKSIRNKRHDIGFRSEGSKLFFKPADVDTWIDRGYIAPKPRK